ncbi:MAG: L-histidine N(alpha)-methyltransferase, partial [Gemmatimonadaceae bacterium]
MPTVDRVRPGIQAWDEKLKIASSLLGAYSTRELVEEKVLPEAANSTLVQKVLESIHKWRDHRPRNTGGPKEFFDVLARKLRCEPHVTGVMIVDASLRQFIDYLPREVRARQLVGGPPGGERCDDLISLPGGKIRSVLLHKKRPLESIVSGVLSGRVDQRHYYLTPDSADVWNNVVRSEGYPTYDDCKAGLRALLESEVWTSRLTAAAPTTTVMLAGGGAPTKDIVILRNLLSQRYLQDATIRYCLVDVSVYMLINSQTWLDDTLPSIAGHERIELRLIHGDVLDLNPCRPHIRSGGSVLFGMTGGTIGNLSEKAFFRSLELVSEEGDLLILSADTLDGLDKNDLDQSLTKKYSVPEIDNFVEPAVRVALDKMGATES